MSDHIAVVPFSVCLNISVDDEPENFACFDEGGTWEEVEWGENNLFPREIKGWTLNKTAIDLKGVRAGYEPFYWEYTKGDQSVGWVDSGEEDEYYIFSKNREHLVSFLKDYSLNEKIQVNGEVHSYF